MTSVKRSLQIIAQHFHTFPKAVKPLGLIFKSRLEKLNNLVFSST